MKDISLEILNKIYDYGYEGYVVGGFVRDMLLNIPSKDVDITTNATPMELKNIFPEIEINNDYGSVTLNYKNYRFELTTYRMDMEYIDNRHPSSVLYVNDLRTDLLRRDFTINAICMDKNGEIIDLLNGISDINNRVIKTIDDSDISFSNDALRILRAIRFATVLNFKLSDEIKASIYKNKHLLKNISYERKKRELDKIFACSNTKEGINLIHEFDLEEVLELDFSRVYDYSDIIGIWAMINAVNYPFTNSERELIEKINEVYKLDVLTNEVLYKFGLYVCILAFVNKGMGKKEITIKYNSLPIKERGKINITAYEICELLNKEPGSFIGVIYNDLEYKILNNLLINEKNEIKRYINDNY